MKTPEWLKEVREWLGTIALLVIAVLALLFIPDYLKRTEKERQEREAVLKYISETTPEEHVERVREYVSLGFTHLVFHFPGPDQERALRLYATEVVPRLRAIS